MKNSLSIDNYIMKIKSIYNSLNDTGEPVPTKDFIMYAIIRVNYDYNAFVCYITNQTSSVVVEEFHSSILMFQHHLQQQDRNEEK